MFLGRKGRIMNLFRLASLMIVVVTATVLLLPGCKVIEKSMKMTQDKGEVLESAYFVDKDTGEYTAVVIIQNNGPSTLRNNWYSANAYDENGDRIEAQSNEYGNYALMGECNWLGSGEKTAIIHSSSSNLSAFNEGRSITDYYVSTPEKLEWSADGDFRKEDATLEPHGLSVTDCSLTDIMEEDNGRYSVTIHNDSNTDYVFDSESYMYKTDKIRFRFDAAVVYRDSDGNIQDGIMLNSDPLQLADIPAGSDVTFTFLSSHVCSDDLKPEYYLIISDIESIVDSDAS